MSRRGGDSSSRDTRWRGSVVTWRCLITPIDGKISGTSFDVIRVDLVSAGFSLRAIDEQHLFALAAGFRDCMGDIMVRWGAKPSLQWVYPGFRTGIIVQCITCRIETGNFRESKQTKKFS